MLNGIPMASLNKWDARIQYASSKNFQMVDGDEDSTNQVIQCGKMGKLIDCASRTSILIVMAH